MSSESYSGGKIGDRVARLVAENAVRARVATLPHVSRVAVDAMNTFMDGIGREAQATAGDLWQQLRDTNQLPDWARRTVEFAHTKRGEWAALLNNAVISGGLGNSIISLINNELAPAVNELIRANPNGTLDAATAAQAVARGVVDFGAGATEAAFSGIDVRRFREMVELTRSTPGITDGLEMLRRGILNTDTIGPLLRNQGLRDEWWTRTLELARVNLTPEQLAALVTFGVFSEEHATPIAAKSGMIAEDFHNLVLGNGQPPSTTDLMEAYRRGIIDHTRLLRGITQGPVRNEWFDMLEALRFSPPPSDAALNAATQNLLSNDEAKRIVTQNGIDPKDFDWLLETYGRPLGISDVAELVNRGELSPAVARQMYLESNIKNKYVDLIPKLFQRILPMDNIRMAYRDGAITREEAARAFHRLGFDALDAEILLKHAEAQKHAKMRDFSEGLIRQMYADRAITLEQAKDGLHAWGYDDWQTDVILSMEDLGVAKRMRDSAISLVRARYVAHRIDDAKTATSLDALEVPPDQRNLLLDLWTVERDASMAHLSTAQVQQAVRKGLITPAAGLQRLLAAGYEQEDAAIIITLAVPAAQP